MADPFDTATDRIFAHPFLGKDATYKAVGSSTWTPVRVLWKQPSSFAEFGTMAATIPDYTVEVRKSEIAAPARKAQFTIDSVVYEVEGITSPPSRRAHILTLKPASI